MSDIESNDVDKGVLILKGINWCNTFLALKVY